MKDRLIDILEQRFACTDVTQMVEFLTESGLMREKHIKSYLIKYEYYERISGGESFTDVKYDLAAEFDTSFSNVKNIIYNCKHIRP